jgi:hypothetical protein
MLSRLAVLFWVAAALPAAHAEGALLQPYAGAGSAPAAPWHVSGLPQQTKPYTQFSVVDVDGKRALKVEANESYGNLLHPLQFTGSAAHLAWQRRIEKPIETAVLRSGTQRLNQWVAERRDVVADFFKTFGAETDQLPPIVGVTVGADSDNTHTHSIAYVAGLALEP